MMEAHCENGHIYDSSIYPSCPYCGGNQNRIDFGEPAAGTGLTAAGGFQNIGYRGRPVGNGGPTMAPRGNGDYQGGPSVSEGGKTRPPSGDRFPGRRIDEENKTTGIMRKTIGFEPVVGWLVCIDGEDKGKDYHLYAKINTIGKSEKMDVCIKGDSTISDDNHARLAYDIKHNNFQLLPGNSSNTLYLNDQPVYEARPILAYDVIEIGLTLLIFIPLCTQRFDWNKDVREVMKAGGF